LEHNDDRLDLGDSGRVLVLFQCEWEGCMGRTDRPESEGVGRHNRRLRVLKRAILLLVPERLNEVLHVAVPEDLVVSSSGLPVRRQRGAVGAIHDVITDPEIDRRTTSRFRPSSSRRRPFGGGATRC